MNTTKVNPYIGPRTFLKEEGHLFFGRDREARDLAALVMSEKLVLYYAQSGAGKSSLINTRLIPELENQLYEVLPVARVSGDLPDGFLPENVYVYNLMRSVIGREIDPHSLENLALPEFLGKLNEDENGYFYDETLDANLRASPEIVPWRRALIIDQFEEVFSTHQDWWEKREAFFKQISKAMHDDPYLWVVLVMREDYIAALDPYAHLLPGGLRVRYYMQRLGREAALRAMKGPVEKLRPYAEGVAEKLVEDLSSVKVQKPDGSLDFQPGQYVEPVQLQVVCYGMWENLPPKGTHITEKNLQEVGSVDDALGKYYAGRLKKVAEEKKVKERLIREWFEKRLIAPGGIRNVVLAEQSKSKDSIGEDVIQALQSDLVRAEKRSGATWYELTHDRLVQPILENNKQWFDENLSPLQRQATLWNDQERNESWLLRDQALDEVEKWAVENQDELTDLENEFLEECRKQQVQAKLNEQAKSARRLRVFIAVVGFLALVALAAAGIAINSANEAQAAKIEADRLRAEAEQARNEAQANFSIANNLRQEAEDARNDAEEAANQALAGNIAAQASPLRNSNYSGALLLGIEAYSRNRENLLTRQTLFDLLRFTPYRQSFDPEGIVSSVAVSPDGSIVAAASCGGYVGTQCARGQIILYDSNLDSVVELADVNSNFGIVYSLDFNGDGTVLAAGGCVPISPPEKLGCVDDEGQITLWDVAEINNPGFIGSNATSIGFNHGGLVSTVTFSPDGKTLATGSYDQSIILWNLTEIENPRAVNRLKGHISFVNDLVFIDSNFIVSAGDDRNLILWDLSRPDAPRSYKNHQSPINAVVFDPVRNLLASAGDDNRIILWEWDLESRQLSIFENFEAHTGFIKGLAFDANGDYLASSSFDHAVNIWHITNSENGIGIEQSGAPLKVHEGAVNGVAFGNHEGVSYLVSGSDDRTVIQWNLASRSPLSRTYPVNDVPSLSGCATSSTLTACLEGEQIRIRSGLNTFLVLDSLDPNTLVGFVGETLYTRDNTQQRNGWITEWILDPQEWVRLACIAADRNLTTEEWNQYLPNVQFEKTCENNS